MSYKAVDLGGDVRKVGLVWQISSYSGWGLLGFHVARRMLAAGDLEPMPFYGLGSLDRKTTDPILLKRLEANANAIITAMATRPNPTSPVRGTFPMLHGLGNGLIQPAGAFTLSGDPDVAIVFLEDSKLDREAVERGRRFATIAAGASWTAEVLRNAGLTQVTVCPQGIDPTIFHAGPPRAHARDRFIIYSGGKLEFRKGQDITVAAFRRFHQRHPDALLVAGWFSPWPALARTMARSPHLEHAPRLDDKGQVDVAGWLRDSGLPEGSFQIAPPMPNAAMGQLLRHADVALFPNRCEGGTNLVAMEAMACGVPTILSDNTGHQDLIADLSCYPLHRQGRVEEGPDGLGTDGWGESDPDEIVEALERIYTDRTAAATVGAKAARRMLETWTWDTRIDRMLSELGLRSC
ncbi:glycosyltransferase family 4 protein [Azospirillum sp. A1-3]|uniref:glycosyltransferase family 4 protein n=1 Tax=Azospirillum sp. A1-3 TaxID=185874 RepID=UPI0020771145|nr:glycosyltransferase family 4 protein [Azospirillum sp. A1-3]MCM8738646.1 glycosyltransferase family 4 protein [Azospirillum sp. A1-3]